MTPGYSKVLIVENIMLNVVLVYYLRSGDDGCGLMQCIVANERQWREMLENILRWKWPAVVDA